MEARVKIKRPGTSLKVSAKYVTKPTEKIIHRRETVNKKNETDLNLLTYHY